MRSRARLAALYPADWLAHTLVVAGRCTFDLKELRYHYPLEAVLPGTTPAQTLRRYVEEGAQERYPAGMPDKIRIRIEHELALISELNFEMYFLTVHDIVRFARSARHSVPGAWLGGQLGGVLLPAHYRGQPRGNLAAV